MGLMSQPAIFKNVKLTTAWYSTSTEFEFRWISSGISDFEQIFISVCPPSSWVDFKTRKLLQPLLSGQGRLREKTSWRFVDTLIFQRQMTSFLYDTGIVGAWITATGVEKSAPQPGKTRDGNKEMNLMVGKRGTESILFHPFNQKNFERGKAWDLHFWKFCEFRKHEV